MIGQIHSVQSLGAVDGPGLRYVVFLQGCPLRCIYCHNPDTWNPTAGKETHPEEIVEEILRYRCYFGEKGGVTLTGGEPLLQATFCAELLRQLKSHGIHTAVDTSGQGNHDAIEAVLPYTDLVLCDLKFPTEELYQKYTGGSLLQTLNFLRRAEALGVDVWIRHVVVPGLTDAPDNIHAISNLAKSFSNVSKIELLPFHKLCEEKYENLGIPFPLASVPACPAETIKQLQQLIPMVYR